MIEPQQIVAAKPKLTHLKQGFIDTGNLEQLRALKEHLAIEYIFNDAAPEDTPSNLIANAVNRYVASLVESYEKTAE